jgi:tetratricopeptide (TPR) repeat protein
VYAGLGRVRTRQGRIEQARRLFARSLELDAKLMDAHAGLGTLEEAEGNWEQAVEHYQAALQAQPHSIDLHAKVAVALLRLGKPAGALMHFERVLAQEPSGSRTAPDDSTDTAKRAFWAAVHADRGKTLEQLGRWEEAVASHDRAVDLVPDNPVYRAGLALALSERGQSQAAQVQLGVAAGIFPTWPEQARKEAWKLATDPDRKKRHGAFALRTAKLACLGTSYRNAECLEALAAAHAELGQFPDAVRWQKQAIELLPGESNADARKSAQERLQFYEAGQPFRQPSPPRPSPAGGDRK